MNPVIIEDVISIPANTTNNNVIVSNDSLRRYLRSPFGAEGELVATISGAGLTVDLDYGSKNVVSNYVPRIETAAQPMQEQLDTINDQWSPNEGDQLVLRCTNTTGGALSLRYRITLYSRPAGMQPEPDKRVTGTTQTIAIGAVDTQIMDGNRYERPPVPSKMKVFMSASSAGLIRRVEVDTQTIAPPSSIPPSNRTPQDPFDLSVAGIEVPDDKLILLPVSNPTAGAITLFWRVELQELYRT